MSYVLELEDALETVRTENARLRAILMVLWETHPGTLSKEQVAVATGYEASGGGFNNALGKLRTLELIEGSRDVRASDDLFD